VVIQQGDIYWIARDTNGSVGSPVRPYVIVQNNLFNRSGVNSVVVCALTANLSRARVPGNVLLKKGEGNLPRPSVANVTQLHTVLKSALRERIGSLSSVRTYEVLRGIDLVLKPREVSPRS
jgi:mRNA interferase MazF